MADLSWRDGVSGSGCVRVLLRGVQGVSGRIEGLGPFLRGPSRGRRPGGLDRASTLAGRGMVLSGQLLRQLRTSAGLSQLELCQAARLSIRMVSDLERGALT